MRRTHFLTAAVAVAGTLGITAALGFGQPDGIDPPAGPVMDTQPSLTSIDQKIDGILINTTDGPFQTAQHQNIAPNDTVTINTGSIRLKRVIMQQGRVIISDTSGWSLSLEAGGNFDVNGPQRRLIDFSNELDVNLVGPLTVVGDDTQNNSSFILVYKELP